jgi:hypothetical protein
VRDAVGRPMNPKRQTRRRSSIGRACIAIHHASARLILGEVEKELIDATARSIESMQEPERH